MGACSKHWFVKEFLDSYKERHFIKEDGTLDTVTTNVVVLTKLLCQHGLVLNGKVQNISEIKIYPQKYFSDNSLINLFNKYKKSSYIKPNLFLFMTVVAVSLFKIMDKIMLGIITTAEQVGFYEVAEKIIAIPTVFITSLGTVMLPRMSNLAGKGKTEENRLLYASAIFAMFMVSSLCFGIMGVSKTFVPFFYGQGYDICIVLYLILLPSCLFLGLANVVRTQYLLPHNMDKEYVVSAFLGAFVNILINLCLIPKWGAIGAAIGTLVAEITVCVYQCYMCRKGIQFFIIIRKSLIFVIDGIIMFLILFNLKIPVENLLLKLGVQIGMGGIIYLMLLTMEVIIYKKIFKQKFFSIKNIC